ncbi:hypothetical protein BU23DRAFT_564522 [Bimuria novae-zelandiae CBS 107.79]|uniref:Uncharacterized protein n=1 Tax=Bimuria novae-zelandiae CBS 107.79 TaxID=1447943 RepID=A0A6A5VP47_9PLEO|nr:hypothetical protein BU23DRAFT_564522 [Bimuria novae-zelandiae CBS 107.79]
MDYIQGKARQECLEVIDLRYVLNILIFSSACSTLHPERPIDFSRIVDHTRFNDLTLTAQHLRLCDGVATTPWNYDRNAFEKFFDPTVKVFAWHSLVPLPYKLDRSVAADLLIKRRGNQVELYASLNSTGKWTVTHRETTFTIYEVTREFPFSFTGKWRRIDRKGEYRLWGRREFRWIGPLHEREACYLSAEVTDTKG